MTLKRLLFSFLLIGMALFSAESSPHIVDSVHSQINFVAEARFFSCHGYFDKWDAQIDLDANKIENSSVKITIDANSINTRVDRRNQHLKSKDFFYTEKYPAITFVSKKVEKAGQNTYNVIGDLTIRDVTKEISIPIEEVFYTSPRGRFRGSFTISRKEFGVSFDSPMNPIQDAVLVQLDINALDKAAMEKMQQQQQQAKPSNQ
jgi:polyisoprenoid-binding protein YceI